MNWIKRLFGNGPVTTEGTELSEAVPNPAVRLAAGEMVGAARTAGRAADFVCNGAWQRHSWLYDGAIFDRCRRCGMER